MNLQDDPRFNTALNDIRVNIQRGVQPIPPAWGDQGDWWVVIGEEVNRFQGVGGYVPPGSHAPPGVNGGDGPVPMPSVGGDYGGALVDGDIDETEIDNWYGEPGGTLPEADPAVAGGIAVAGAAGLVRVSALGAIAAAVVKVIVRVVGRYTGPFTLTWNRLPTWAKYALAALGVDWGTDLLVDMGEDDTGLIPFPGLPGFGSGRPGKGDIVEFNGKTHVIASDWEANNVWFYRFTDGYLGVQNKHGVWKVWKPKKPIVLFRTGQNDLQDLLSADSAVEKDAKRVKKMLNRRGWKVSRS